MISNVLASSYDAGLIAQTRVIYQWLRVEQLDQWWHWLALVCVCTLVLSFVLYWYRRDTAEHFRPIGWAMTTLRIAAFLGLLLYFLQLEKRTEQRVVRDSRLAILVDTSMSMSLPGTPTSIGTASSLTRSEEATRLIAQSDLLERLSKDHQLSVYRFGKSNRPASLAAINKVGVTDKDAPSGSGQDSASLAEARQMAWIAGGICVAAIICLTISLTAQILGFKDWYEGSWILFLGTILFLTSLLVGAYAIVPNSEHSIAALLGSEASTQNQPNNNEEQDDLDIFLPESWDQELSPRGTETRLGDAIKFVLDREASNPLAGIVVVTDGRNNEGIDPRNSLTLAQMRRVPLYVVGLGSDENPKNISLVEVDVPSRLYPGDRFSLKALVAGSGLGGKTATVQVLVGPKDAEDRRLEIEAEETVEIPEDGSMVPAEFQLEPKTIGEWRYLIKVIPPDDDAIEEDNSKDALVEVLERKNRVLILAGGPMREYQFVRNLLYRDRNVESHVLLQSGSESSSQEAQELLSEFPADLQALSQYDAILAFDPDWTRIPESALRNIERWVSEQAGGLLMVAGSVEMPKWLARSASGNRARYLRSLSPVILERRGSALLAAGRIEGDNAWPLQLTPEGQQSEFLWLTDDAASSMDLWEDFDGVHSFYAAYELKPGAKALLYFSDPKAAIEGQLPVYMANQYYGAGRTLFVGGGELWRMRSFGDQYFDRLYTKLVRWISQSRLLLGFRPWCLARRSRTGVAWRSSCRACRFEE